MPITSASFEKMFSKLFAPGARRFCGGAMVVLLAAGTASFSQTQSGAPPTDTSTPTAETRNEFYGLFGKAYVPDKKIQPNGGFNTSPLSFQSPSAYEAGLAHQFGTFLGRDLFLDIPIAVIPSISLNKASGGNPSSNYSAVFFTPGLRLMFRQGSKIRPWVAVGAGAAHLEGGDTLLDGSTNFKSRILTTYAFEFGGGVDYRFNRRVSFRGQIRDFITASPPVGVTQTQGFSNHFPYSGGVVFHF